MEAKTDSLNHFNLLQSASDDIVQCPLCETKMKRSEVAEHCEQEMGNLKKMQLKAINQLSQPDGGADEESHSEERRKPWTVFQRVQKNRQTRLRQRTRRRPASPAERICPLCNQSFAQEDIQRHAEQCLRRSNGTANGDAAHSSDDEDAATDEYEEYEWAGQKRIRVSSLIPGGYAAIGVGQASTHNNGQTDDEEDEDLNVDEDDTQIYGPAQYNESDVLAAGSELNITDVNEEDSDVTNYMRWLITGNANANTITQTTTPPHSDDTKTIDGTISTPANAAEKTTAAEHIIESLKAKLRHYENHVQNKFKCLICLDDYKNPAISVSCWHVHCEQCWMRSLGARKLCPQCNLITTPKDLRRIYM